MTEIALARAMLYNLLAASFGDPPTLQLLQAWKQTLPEAAEVTLDEVRRAYTRLLVGPGDGYAPPYASFYLEPSVGGKPLLMGAEAVAVEQLYRQVGLEIAPGHPRLPDHLALELQFMQHLCSREAAALNLADWSAAHRWRKMQQDFLQNHLSPWLPAFAQKVYAVGAHPLYRALVELTLEFVQSEIEEVAQVADLHPVGEVLCVSM